MNNGRLSSHQEQGNRRSQGESGGGVSAETIGGEEEPLLLYPSSNAKNNIRRRSPLTTASAAQQGVSSSAGMNRSTAGPSEIPSYINDPQFYSSTDSTSQPYFIHNDNDRSVSSTDSDSRRIYRSPATHEKPKEAPPPLLEIPEEVYAVRKAALQVMKPLTSSWLVVSIGFALSVLLGMTRWTQLMSDLPYWFILLPSWGSHIGLLWCHVRSARALSTFIAEANENRQRPDSTDHMDRTEYLPLLQRSLKFGFKTGLLSFCTFVFEVLLYVRLVTAHRMPLGVVFIPIWLVVVGGILDGIICKTQHCLRLICWILVCAAMVLAVLRVDGSRQEIRWRIILAPVVAVLSIASGTLIYIIYGHQVGYYRLTESQLTAGILYSLSALICVVLVVVIGEVIPLARPVEIETRIFVVIMAPMVVCLTGMGAYSVSRDEFGRLLLYGGQAAVHPMKLRWEPEGWTSVPTSGVTILPMFGEVSYRPLEKETGSSIELCTCCVCYPHEEQDEIATELHPYLAPPSQRNSSLLQERIQGDMARMSGHSGVRGFV